MSDSSWCDITVGNLPAPSEWAIIYADWYNWMEERTHRYGWLQ